MHWQKRYKKMQWRSFLCSLREDWIQTNWMSQVPCMKATQKQSHSLREMRWRERERQRGGGGGTIFTRFPLKLVNEIHAVALVWSVWLNGMSHSVYFHTICSVFTWWSTRCGYTNVGDEIFQNTKCFHDWYNKNLQKKMSACLSPPSRPLHWKPVSLQGSSSEQLSWPPPSSLELASTSLADLPLCKMKSHCAQYCHKKNYVDITLDYPTNYTFLQLAAIPCGHSEKNLVLFKVINIDRVVVK